MKDTAALDTVSQTVAQLQVAGERRTRFDRAMSMLRDSRIALAEALVLVEDLAGDDPEIASRVHSWRIRGGVGFPS